MAFHHAESTVVAADPDTVYTLVSDITRTGEWSPICVACWWDEGDAPGADGPVVGAWFTGRNETPRRTWETRSQVVVADRGREFAWFVGGNIVRWGYQLRPVDGGTEITESWELRDEGIAFFHEKYGDRAQAEIRDRIDAAHGGIPATLARIAEILDAS